MLRQTGEVHVSTGMPRRQHLVQTIRSERKYGYPYFSIQLMKLIDGRVPEFSLEEQGPRASPAPR